MDNILEEIKAVFEGDNKSLIQQIEDIVLAQHEKRDFTKMKSGDKFLYCNLKWTYLGMEQDGALCIATEWDRNMPFDVAYHSDWNKSSLKERLNSDFLDRLNKKDLKPFKLDLIADNGDNSFGTSTQYVGILNCDLYRKYREVIPTGYDIWTCTPLSGDRSLSHVRFIGWDGILDSVVTDWSYYVMPVCVFCC